MSVRLFVALELPPAAAAALASFRDAAADPAVWRPVPDESLHITLAFIGHRPEEDAEGAAGIVRSLPFEPPPLRLAGALLLPPRRARVLCAAVTDETGALAALQRAVSDGLEGAGLYTPEARPFRPHVTVGRLRSGARAPREVAAAPEPLGFPGGPVTLFRSHVGRGGARYEPLARTPAP